MFAERTGAPTLILFSLINLISFRDTPFLTVYTVSASTPSKSI